MLGVPAKKQNGKLLDLEEPYRHEIAFNELMGGNRNQITPIIS